SVRAGRGIASTAGLPAGVTSAARVASPVVARPSALAAIGVGGAAVGAAVGAGQPSQRAAMAPKRRAASAAAVSPPAPTAAAGPPHWETVLGNVRQMRAARDAAVDRMGCEALGEGDVPPAQRRFTHLVALLLSSQTRDEVTAAAVGRLKE